MDKPNGIASAADFRQLAESSAWAKPERVVLPKSGFAVIVRRPTKFYWALRRSGWQEELREKIDSIGMGLKPEFSNNDLLELAREDQRMLSEAFVEPKLSLHPGPDDIDPNWLPEEDAQFILKYLRGQVLASGQDLDAFRRGKPFNPEGSSADGAIVREDSH